MSDATEVLTATAEVVKPTEPKTTPEPAFALSRILSEVYAVREGVTSATSADDALVMLIARLMEVPTFDANAMEAVRGVVLR